MAWLVGFEHTDRIRAIVAIDALPPPRIKLPESDPINRLALFLGRAEKSPSAALLKALITRLQSFKRP